MVTTAPHLAVGVSGERIAKAGRKLVLEKHTYAHRVDEIVRVMGEF